MHLALSVLNCVDCEGMELLPRGYFYSCPGLGRSCHNPLRATGSVQFQYFRMMQSVESFPTVKTSEVEF